MGDEVTANRGRTCLFMMLLMLLLHLGCGATATQDSGHGAGLQEDPIHPTVSYNQMIEDIFGEGKDIGDEANGVIPPLPKLRNFNAFNEHHVEKNASDEVLGLKNDPETKDIFD